jgi:hypothetical protein
MSKSIDNEVLELLESGKNKGQVEGFLRFQHDLSVNDAKKVVARVCEANNIGTSHGTADHSETVAYLRANYGKIDKKELIEGMCEVNGKTYKTNQHAYNYIAMMIEWARQEAEA